jgi:hypothetical protein
MRVVAAWVRASTLDTRRSMSWRRAASEAGRSGVGASWLDARARLGLLLGGQLAALVLLVAGEDGALLGVPGRQGGRALDLVVGQEPGRAHGSGT